jgi:hypothetical protein
VEVDAPRRVGSGVGTIALRLAALRARSAHRAARAAAHRAIIRAERVPPRLAGRRAHRRAHGRGGVAVREEGQQADGHGAEVALGCAAGIIVRRLVGAREGALDFFELEKISVCSCDWGLEKKRSGVGVY